MVSDVVCPFGIAKSRLLRAHHKPRWPQGRMIIRPYLAIPKRATTSRFPY